MKYKVKRLYNTLKSTGSRTNQYTVFTMAYSTKSSVQQTSNANLTLTENDIKLKQQNSVFEKLNESLMPYMVSINEMLYTFKNSSISKTVDTTEKLINQYQSMKKSNLNKPPVNLRTASSEELKIVTNKTESNKPVAWATTTEKDLIDEKIIKLCDSITKASSSLIRTILINDLLKVLYETPDLRYVIYRERNDLLKNLLILRENAQLQSDKNLVCNINECLALMGYIDQTGIKFKGINILSLDGGGSKGFVTIEVLKNIEKKCGKPIHEIFDYICGVSTGAVLASLIGIMKMPLKDVERMYELFTKDLFERNMTAGLSNLFKAHSYYDTQMWETMLKDTFSDRKLVSSARDKKACKIGIISNVATPSHMKVFLFRNYNLPLWAQSHYDGTCRHKIWEAVRASSAAPGYYEDFKLDGHTFFDGGLLANNPTAIAIHEAKQIWPRSDINCIVSIGNGRFAGYASNKSDTISLKQKIQRIFSGIGDPESVHTMLLDTMKPSTYFRFNPYMTEEFNLDEKRPEKFTLMRYETNMYMRRNEFKFNLLSKQLLKPQSKLKQVHNYLINKKILNVSFKHQIY